MCVSILSPPVQMDTLFNNSCVCISLAIPSDTMAAYHGRVVECIKQNNVFCKIFMRGPALYEELRVVNRICILSPLFGKVLGNCSLSFYIFKIKI